MNKRYEKSLKPKLTMAIALTLFLMFSLNITQVITAYFNSLIQNVVKPKLDVDILFGSLDESLAVGEWGTDGNPYLIENNQHLINLYVLQNSPDHYIIDEDSVFQISNDMGEPNYIGGPSANQLFAMQSIGTEEFPFVSKIRGVRTTDPDKFVTLPTGEKSDTSAIGNIKVVGRPNQVDIGLFGNAGPTGAEAENLAPNEYIGEISTMLLYNIQLTSSTYGAYEAGHRYFVTSGNYETNHVGILVGHAQYVKVDTISVYYSSTNNVSHVDAFDFTPGSSGKYTTAGGIIGYYRRVVVDGETEFPVSSDGSSEGVGSGVGGLGFGIVYSQDIWEYMETHTSVGDPAPLDSYDIQSTFGEELYGEDNPDKKYFHVGVFTFSHSTQAKANDRLAKLWSTTGSNQWTIATNGESGYQAQNTDMGPATRYSTTMITHAETNAVNGNGYLDARFDQPNYRYLIVSEYGGKEYALMRYGSVAIGVEIQTNNLIIPDGELEYYTFEVLSNRTPNLNYPPYDDGYAYQYNTPARMQFRRSSGGDLLYAVWGKIVQEDGSIREAPRPLRINAQSNLTPTTSFMATGSTTFVEGIRFRPRSTGAFTNYNLQRTGANGRGNTSNWWATFTPQDGFSAYLRTYAPSDAMASFRIYAVRVTNNISNPSESPQTTRYYLQEKQPLAGAPKQTFDMETNVLFYTGNPASQVPATRYKYNLQTVASLGWVDNFEEPITKGSTALMMGDPTSYYYLESNQRFFGVTTGIPSPISSSTINVPEGAIGFTVHGTGIAGTTAKVYVMVATDPMQGIEQHITISRFGTETSSNQLADRTTIASFVLPPAPDTPGVGTKPIQINHDGNEYSVYTNFNTVLVAYEFEVPSRYNITYFLEASRGSARFVYLSGERTVSNDNNPLHENDISFPPLSSIDYVFKGINDPNRVATVGSPEYISSLTVPYFGLTKNPEFSVHDVPLKDRYIVPISTGFNFTYNISRVYNPDDEKYYIYIWISANVNGSGYTSPINLAQLKVIQQNMNFNFSENSYLDKEHYQYVYSDVVSMNINGYNLVNWADIK